MQRSTSQIQALLEAALTQHIFSGYQFYAARDQDILHCASGVTSYWPSAQPISETSQFDIGSLTKAVCTTALCARLIDRQQLELNLPLSQLLPMFTLSPLGAIRLKHLLSHTSGLTSWLPLYRTLGTGSLVDWLLLNEKDLVASLPGRSAVYSDFNFMILGLVLENILGDLGNAFRNEVALPLGLTAIEFGPLANGKNVAATEYRSEQRSPLQGQIFDENAAAIASPAGHAGQFSSAQSLAPLCREWLRARKGESDWLSRATALQFTSRSQLAPQSTWALGWDTKSAQHSTAGDYFSPASFGHLGYPGTSIWMDPEVEGFAIFLCNRVHPSRYDERIRNLRPQLHNMVAERWRKA